jgi:hypothetical protein
MTAPFSDLGDPVQVPFSQVHLDPNNPRIAPEKPPGYNDPDAIFADPLQRELTDRVYKVYKAGELEAAIVAQGWVPIDPIVVWQHPDRPGHYIVVEGNTRTAVLRTIRNPVIQRERKKLERLTKGGKVPAEEIRQQEQLIARLEGVIAATESLVVYPVIAATAAELEEKLPRLLGVRHITHAKQWTPYATNLYITSLYDRLFHDKFGEDEALRLVPSLITEVSAMVSLGDTKTRRNIQAASAFGHFKRAYEDRLPEGGAFSDEDQYFFENILQNKYAWEQFGFSADRLHLPTEAEEALFEWAFKLPRKNEDEDENPNVFYKAENIRLWAAMARYDNKHGTSFAAQFDVSNPEDTRPMRQVEAEFLHHKARRTPVDTLTSLLEALQDLKADTMISQSGHLEPVLLEIGQLTQKYLKMMTAAAA